MNVKESILAEEGYKSEKKLIEDYLLLNALSKVEQYRAECEFFEKKYGQILQDFEKKLHRRRGKENFEKEEDLEDWQFANNALKWWQEVVEVNRE